MAGRTTSGSASYHDGAPTAASAVCVNGKSATRTALCSRTAEAATGSAWRQAAAPVASSSTMAARMGDARVAAAMLLHKERVWIGNQGTCRGRARSSGLWPCVARPDNGLGLVQVELDLLGTCIST
jgi:hypothetical protein